MATVNQTGQVKTAVGTPPEASKVSRPQDRPLEGEGRSEFVPQGPSLQVAVAGDVHRPHEFLIRQSLDLHEQFKERLTDLERVLSGTTDARELHEARETGLIRFAQSKLVLLQVKVGQERDAGKRGMLAAQVEELRKALEGVEKTRFELERGVDLRGPRDVSAARTELALQKLQGYFGAPLPEGVKKDPVELRRLVVTALQKKLEKISEGRRKTLLDIRRWEEVRKSGSPEEREKAEKALAELKTQQLGFLKGEKLYSEGILAAERWVFELEKGEIEGEFENLEPSDETGETTHEAGMTTASTGPLSGSAPASSKGPEGERALGIASAGSTNYEGGESDYIGLAGVDLTGTNMAVMSSSSRIQQEARKTRKVIDQLLKRLLAGDFRALDLALIMLAKQSQSTTIQIGAKMIKALDQLDKHQEAIVKQLGKVSTDDKSYSSKTAALNIQANRIAMDRTAITNLLRDVMASMEEIQNVTKSFLDIQGAQVRHLSRFNT